MSSYSLRQSVRKRSIPPRDASQEPIHKEIKLELEDTKEEIIILNPEMVTNFFANSDIPKEEPMIQTEEEICVMPPTPGMDIKPETPENSTLSEISAENEEDLNQIKKEEDDFAPYFEDVKNEPPTMPDLCPPLEEKFPICPISEEELFNNVFGDCFKEIITRMRQPDPKRIRDLFKFYPRKINELNRQLVAMQKKARREELSLERLKKDQSFVSTDLNKLKACVQQGPAAVLVVIDEIESQIKQTTGVSQPIELKQAKLNELHAEMRRREAELHYAEINYKKLLQIGLNYGHRSQVSKSNMHSFLQKFRQ